MTALTATVQGRKLAESLMVDTAMITRPGGAPTFDPNTGLLTPTVGATVYTGVCRLRQPTATEAEVLFGEEQVTRTTFIVCVPHTTTGVSIGDVVTFIESGDPDVLTRQFKITAVPVSTFTLYKGYPAEVVE